VISLPTIEANQTIRLPLWLRGAAVGLHTIGILFHYETHGAVEHKMDYRLCRYFREVQVLASLKVPAPRVWPDPCSIHDFQLMLEVENLLPAANFTVQGLDAVSKDWVIKLRSRVPVPGEEGLPSCSLHKIAPGQKSAIALTAERADSETNWDANADIFAVSEVCFEPNRRIRSVAPAMLALVEAVRPSGPPGEVDLVVSWTMEGQGKTACSGHHFVPGLQLITPCEGIVFQRPPIKVTMDSPAIVDHDFKANPACIIPITLLVTSCCETKELGITFQAFGTDDEDVAVLGGPSPAGAGPYTAAYAWVGVTSKSFKEPLLPGKTLKVRTSVVVWGNGLFNLNRYRVHVMAANAPTPLIYIAHAAHPVRVKAPHEG